LPGYQWATVVTSSKAERYRQLARDLSCDVAIPNQFSDLPPLHAAFGDCLHKADLAVRDYTQAREVASRQGWAGLAQQMDAFIKQAEMRAQLARSMMDRVRAIMELQNR
jgi:hypothetical protein